jgi:HEAT repeat protein
MALEGASAGMLLDRDSSPRLALLIEPDPERVIPVSGLAQLLQDKYGLAARNLVELYGERATHYNIRRTMVDLFERLGQEDSVLVYVSMPVLYDGRATYLLPYDGNPEEPWTALPLQELLRWVAALRAGTGLAVVSSCPSYFEYDRIMLEEALFRSIESPMTFVSVCDLSEIRPTEYSRGERLGIEHRANVADLFREVLMNAAVEGSGRLNAGQLFQQSRRRLLEKGEFALDIRLYESAVPSLRRFAFVPREAVRSKYEPEFAAARDDKERSALLYAVARAAQSSDASTSREAISFLKWVALGAAPGQSSAQANATRDFSAQAQAVAALGQVGSPAARDALRSVAEEARNRGLWVGALAVSEIARLRSADERDLDLLRRALSDDDPRVREAAARGIGLLQARNALPELKNLAGADPEKSVRIAAIQSLSVLGGADERDTIIGLLQDDDPDIQREASTALGRMAPSPAAVEALLAMLAPDANTMLQTAAAYALGAIAPALRGSDQNKVVDRLAAVLGNGNGAMRQAAAFALGRIGGPRAEELLLGILRDAAADDVRIAAIEALSLLRSEAALPDILGAAMGGTAGLRRAAAAALGAIGSETAINTLLGLLEDQDPYTRQAAKSALDALESPPVEPFIANLESSSPDRRLASVEGLGRSGDSAAVDVLIDLLNDENSDIRQAAVGALTRFRDNSSTSKVVAALDAHDVLTRIGAAMALRDVPSLTVVVALTAHAGDANSTVRAEIVRALGGREDPRAVQTVFDAATDPDVGVRQAAAEALSKLGTPEAQERLREIAKKDPSEGVAQSAAKTLWGIPLETVVPWR